MKGKVWLVGAGPGDAGLITVKGLKALREADVIVYDQLASEALLNEGKDGAVWIDAGKTAGNHHMKQADICQLLVTEAQKGQRVVRLKGGDPFVFGRGGEEALALAEAGIDFQVIPGVSSAYGAAAYGGIPVTHRRMASSFHVITGHEDPEKEASVLDYRVLAQEEGTLVFLMGLARMGSICSRLMACGKDPETPAAVISRGTTARQRCVVGTVKDIAQRVIEEGIAPPAVLVIGDVVTLQSKLNCQPQKPLSGKRILVTASRETAQRLGQMIEDQGGEAIPVSLIHIRPCEDLCLSPVLSAAAGNTWLVFTSRNGVRLFFKQLRREQYDLRNLASKKIAVIGAGTEAALEDYGFYADLIPERACSEALAEALCREAEAAVLLFRSEEGSRLLTNRLYAAGIPYTDVALYETKRQYQKVSWLARVLQQVDAVAFCSASAVDAFCAMTQERDLMPKTVCIGPVTAKKAEICGLRIDAAAKKYDLEGLVQCLCDIL